MWLGLTVGGMLVGYGHDTCDAGDLVVLVGAVRNSDPGAVEFTLQFE